MERTSELGEVSALVQQGLLAHGARYVTRATESNWKRAPVVLELPQEAANGLRAGRWLVLPWSAPTPDELSAWLARLLASGPAPTVLALVVAEPVRAAELARVSAAAGCELVLIEAADLTVAGGRSAAGLADALAPEHLPLLHDVNPLAHLPVLGDARQPEIFFERLRRADHGVPMTLGLIALNVAIFLWLAPDGLALHHRLLEQEWRTAGRPVHDLDWATFWRFVQAGFLPAQLGDAGANVAALTVGEHQAWRLLTCAFLHANVLHIAMNMWVLRTLGDTAERLFGSLTFGLLFLLSGLGGSILSLAWTLRAHPTLPSVGASGAVFGVMGGLIGFALTRRSSVPPDVRRALLRGGLWFAVVNIGLGLALPMVDNGAHMGGLLVGLGLGAAWSRDLPPAAQPSLRRRVAVLAAGLALLAAGYGWTVALLAPA
jgi:membrane associated rhomboid family serine protease